MDEKKFTEGEISDEELPNIRGGLYNGMCGPCIVYTLQRGDTLTKVAARYGTTVEILVKLNNIQNMNRVYAGHKLLIPAR